MKKIETMDEALYYLKEEEILLLLINKKKTFFARRLNKIYVRGENQSYIISIQEFTQLYQDNVFYIYEQKEEDIEIDKEKDEEYYRLWHK